MLNKELLLTTESQIAGHVKLTVGGTSRDAFGYIPDENAGSINRIPTWNRQGKPIKMFSLYVDPTGYGTVMLFYQSYTVDANSITMTIVEKKLTVVLNLHTSYYSSNIKVFDSSDIGKTFTIVFDPEPTGYV